MSAPSPAQGRRRLGLQAKVAWLIGLPALLITVVLGTTSKLQIDSLVSAEVKKRGLAIGEELAASLAYSIFSADDAGLKIAAERTRRHLADTVYVVVRDSKGTLLASSLAPELAAQGPEALPLERSRRAVAGEPAELGGIALLPVTAPVVFEEAEAAAAEEAGLDLGLIGGEAEKPQADGETGRGRQVGTVQIGLRLDAMRNETQKAGLRALAIALGVLAASVAAAALAARKVVRRVERLAKAAGGIASGDLRQEVEVAGSDEIADLALAFQSMSRSLRAMVGDLRQASSDVEREAASVLGTLSEQSAMAVQQATAINQTSSTVNEIAQSSKQTADQAESVIGVAQRSEELTREGQHAVEEARIGLAKLGDQVKAIASSITELLERSQQISDIVSTVKELAEQSNLLALNASLEAAKAGEQGRGFAVVAHEMRNLAEQSRRGAQEVGGILAEIQKSTGAVVEASEEGSKRALAAMALAEGAGGTITGLAGVIRDSTSAARQIANNTREQTTGVEQIVSSMQELSGSMQVALEGTKRIEAVAGNLNVVSRRLSELVGRYRV